MKDLRNKLEDAGDGLDAIGQILNDIEPDFYKDNREYQEEWTRKMGLAVSAIGQHIVRKADCLHGHILDVENMLKQREMDENNENNHEPVQVNVEEREGSTSESQRGVCDV